MQVRRALGWRQTLREFGRGGASGKTAERVGSLESQNEALEKRRGFQKRAEESSREKGRKVGKDGGGAS